MEEDGVVCLPSPLAREPGYLVRHRQPLLRISSHSSPYMQGILSCLSPLIVTQSSPKGNSLHLGPLTQDSCPTYREPSPLVLAS